MLGDVGQGLGHYEVRRCLHRLGRPPIEFHIHLHWDGTAVGQGGDRRAESAVAQECRVDAPSEISDVGQSAFCFSVGLLEELPGGRGIGRNLLPGHTELHGQGDESLLGAVVQVAFDPAAFGQSRRKHPRTAVGQLLHALGEPGTPARPQQRPSQGDVCSGQARDQEIPGEYRDRQEDDRAYQSLERGIYPDALP